MAKLDRLPGLAQTGTAAIAAVGAQVADIAAVTQTSADTTAITAAAGEATAADLTLTQALQVDYDKAVADIAALTTAVNSIRAALDAFNLSA